MNFYNFYLYYANGITGETHKFWVCVASQDEQKAWTEARLQADKRLKPGYNTLIRFDKVEHQIALFKR
jgi:hypothetical protein